MEGILPINFFYTFDLKDKLIKIAFISGANYPDLLEEVLYPSVRILLPHPALIRIVQDNCPAHNSPEVRMWLEAHPDVEIIPWPAKSPDFNVIENLWARMKFLWEPADRRTKEALLQHATTIWERLRGLPELCERMVDSMPSRLQAVIVANGQHSADEYYRVVYFIC